MMRRMLCGAINPMIVAVRIRIGVRIAKSGSRTMSPGIDLYLYPSSVSIRSGFEHLRVLFQRSRCCVIHGVCICIAKRLLELYSTSILVARRCVSSVCHVRSTRCGNCCPNNHCKGKSHEGLNSKKCRINQSYHNNAE